MRCFVVGALLVLSALASAGDKVLHFWAVTGSQDDVGLYADLGKDFEKKTGIKVEVTSLAWGSFATKYFASMAAGLPPDIGVTNLGGPYDYGSVGGLVDLRAEFPKETAEIEKQFDPKLLKMFTVGKQLYGLPTDLSTLVMYYRTDIFEKLGLSAPKTWSELNSTIAKLEANGYKYYFGFTWNAQWAISLYTMPYGLTPLERDAQGNPVVNWTKPGYLKGVMEAMRLWHMHDSPGKDLGPRMVGMFRSNEKGTALPLVLDLHATYMQIDHDAPEIKGKWAVAPWPKADDGKPYNVMGGTAYVIFRKSKMKHEALEWLKYLISDRASQLVTLNRIQRKSQDASFTIPPTKSMWEPQNYPFWDRPDLEKVRPLISVMRSTIPTFETVPSLHGNAEVGRMEANHLDQMATYIHDQIGALAQKHNMKQSDLFKAFGRGDLTDEHQQLEQKVEAKLKAGYETIAPKALEVLKREDARYQTRFGDVISNLPVYEKRANALDIVKAIAVLIFLGAVITVLARPNLRKHWTSYIFVGIPLVLALTFVFVPAAVALYLSLTDYHPVLPLSTAQWVGSENYMNALASGDVLSALLRTLKYAVWCMPVGVILALVFAYFLNQKLVGQRFWRFLYFSPLVTSVVSIALIFTQLFLSSPQGWLNGLLLSLGITRDPIPFLNSEHTFLNCVIVLAIWHGLAFTILVFLAGLQQIPDALYEAAAIDGASNTRRFWHVAIPGLRPQLFFITVLGFIGSFQVFETMYTLANKSGDAGARFGPNDSGLTMVPLIYHTGFETFEMGKSAAIAYILFAIILALTFIQLWLYKKGEVNA